MSLGANQTSAAISGIIKLTATLKPQVPIPRPNPQGGLFGSGGLSCGRVQSGVCWEEGPWESRKQAAQMLLYAEGSRGAPQMLQARSGNDSTSI